MNVSQIASSRFLKQADVGTGVIATIDYVEENVNIGTTEEPEQGFVLHFLEELKPMVLKPTNANLLAAILDSDETDHWQNKQIVVYTDPTICFGHKRVGGIRVKAVQAPAPALRAPPAPVQRAANAALQRPATLSRPAAPPQRPAAGPVRPTRNAPQAQPVDDFDALPKAPPEHDPSMDGDPGLL